MANRLGISTLLIGVLVLLGCENNSSSKDAIHAIRNHDIEAFSRAVDKMGNINIPLGDLQRTLAHRLASDGISTNLVFLDTVLDVFVEHGGDLNRRDIYGKTPLHYVVLSEQSKELYSLLLAHGASQDINDKTGCSPRDYLNQKTLRVEPELHNTFRNSTNGCQ